MRRGKRILALLGGFLLAFLLTGCVQSAEELYALPRQSDAYYDLQAAIDTVLTGGADYSGPMTGSNQQAVQLADLDGDGDDEALVFIKTSGERPLKVYIFDREGGSDSYENVAVIEGDGSAFDSVDYVQLDGQPGLELLVGRQLSNQVLQSLSVYSYTGERMVELMSANYSEYALVDLDGDNCRDVFLLRLETEERTGVAELYRWREGQMTRDQEANLSVGALAVKRIITGQMCEGVPAVFVASSYGEDSLITDIFAFRDQTFQNVSNHGETGLSVQTVRNYNVYATDIDEDGLIELPMLVALPSATAEETYWTIDWYNLKLDGSKDMKLTTYHNYLGGWYLILPDRFHGQISMGRSEEVSGVRGYSVQRWNGREQAPDDIFTVYAFTGEDRGELAVADGRFLLAEKGDTAYAASLGDCDWARTLTQEDLIAMFHFIHLDWNSGER